MFFGYVFHKAFGDKNQKTGVWLPKLTDFLLVCVGTVYNKVHDFLPQMVPPRMMIFQIQFLGCPGKQEFPKSIFFVELEPYIYIYIYMHNLHIHINRINMCIYIYTHFLYI